MPAIRLVRGEDGLRWGWAGDEDALDRMLWPVVHSAAELLLSDDCRWLRRCAGEDCRLLFVDHSHRHRKWCEKACRERAKALRYYYRRGRQRRDHTFEAMLGKPLWEKKKRRRKK